MLGLWTLGEGRESQGAEYRVLMGPESPLPRPLQPRQARAGHALPRSSYKTQPLRVQGPELPILASPSSLPTRVHRGACTESRTPGEPGMREWGPLTTLCQVRKETPAP